MKRRIIARIDVKNDHAIKGIHLEGLRKVGKPNDLARDYFKQGIDEIIFMDAVAAYYDRNSLAHIIEEACKEVYIPITVGGGIRTIDDIQKALNSGADKVAINTKATQDPEFIQEAAKIFGSQCIVASIDAKQIADNAWEAYYDNGREPTGKDAVNWAKELESLGAGEILITSIDRDGTKKGFDIELTNAISNSVNIPVIASGGAGDMPHISSLFSNPRIDAAALASVLHYKLLDISEIKHTLNSENIKVRT